MKSGKKFTAIVALILCAATLLMPIHITAADESEAPFTVTFAAEEKIYHPGDTIEVIGTLTGIADGYGLIMLYVDSDDVEYDESVMTLTGSAAIDYPSQNWDGENTANGEVWLEDITQKNPITSTEGVLSDALSFKLIFSVKEDATFGSTTHFHNRGNYGLWCII